MSPAASARGAVDGIVVGSGDIGRLELRQDDIEINAGRRTEEMIVANTGDRPVQVGSHFHFFEVNSALAFDRARAFGMHLDIPSGTAARFEPGEEKKVVLTEYAGKQAVYGFNRLTDGNARSAAVKAAALQRARAAGFSFERER
jgi:urease subunit gamma/beta